MSQDIALRVAAGVGKEVATWVQGDRPTEAVLVEAKERADALKKIIEGKKNPVVFRGEQYIEYEDWQTLGHFYGLVAKTKDSEPVEIFGVKGAKAKADIVFIKTGEVVGSAEAYCMSDEANFKGKSWFMLASMAQTRAGAKAFRNLLSWVIVMAGYSSKLFEEELMGAVNQGAVITEPQTEALYAMAKQNFVDPKVISAHIKTRYHISRVAELPQKYFIELNEWIKAQAPKAPIDAA